MEDSKANTFTIYSNLSKQFWKNVSEFQKSQKKALWRFLTNHTFLQKNFLYNTGLLFNKSSSCYQGNFSQLENTFKFRFFCLSNCLRNYSTYNNEAKLVNKRFSILTKVVIERSRLWALFVCFNCRLESLVKSHTKEK